MSRPLSPTKQKILLLLFGGLAFGYSFTPGKQWQVASEMRRAWRAIDPQPQQKKLRNGIQQLYTSKLVARHKNKDGSYTITLTERGKLRALTYRFETLRLKRSVWDGKWRIVMFDIPEDLNSGRDSLREKLRSLGFYELQKSVLIFPYECQDELEFIIEFFGMREYVRFGILESIDNELHLKKLFKLH